MRDPATCPPDAELAVTALRYAAGAMPPAEAEAFEARLGEDQIARDALAEAVRLSAAASGAPVPTPDPLVRSAVAERLHPTWLSRLFPRRPYRGHPAVWAGLGGGVAVAVALVVGAGWQSEPTVARSHPPMHSGKPMLEALTLTTYESPVAPPAAPQVAVEKPVPTRLNPMGMEKHLADGIDLGPSPVIGPPAATAPVPAPGPAAKPTGDKIAEGPNEANPMGEPAIGMMTSKL